MSNLGAGSEEKVQDDVVLILFFKKITGSKTKSFWSFLKKIKIKGKNDVVLVSTNKKKERKKA